jgi:hypothetical protein
LAAVAVKEHEDAPATRQEQDQGQSVTFVDASYGLVETSRREIVPFSAKWAFPYFDYDAFTKEFEGHLASCRENMLPAHDCYDVNMFDEIGYATKIAQEYQTFFESQPGYNTYLHDLGEYYSISGTLEQQAYVKKFYTKYPNSLLEIFGEDTQMNVMNPFVAQYYRTQKGVSFSDPTTFGNDTYGRAILQSNADLLKKVGHPELINNTPIATAYLSSLWACANNPLGTDDPRCAFSRIYSELVDYHMFQNVNKVANKVANKATKPGEIFPGMPVLPRLRLRPPPPPPGICTETAPTPSAPEQTPESAPTAPEPKPEPTPTAPTPTAPEPTPTAPEPAPPAPTPTPSAPTPTPSAATPYAPVPDASPSSANSLQAKRTDAAILQRLRRAPVLTSGFGGGRYFYPSPGFGTGIVL